MKPSVLVDARGIVLCLTNDKGEALEIPLSAETAAELALQLASVKFALATKEGQRVLVKGIGRLFWELATKGRNGTPETE
jgi:hypothetical protein